MLILAIETSCDDTCAAVLEDDKVLASVISSQIDLHKKWGGVVPDVAKRAHADRIETVIAEAIMRSKFKILNLKQNLPPTPSLTKEGEKDKKLDLIIKKGMEVIEVIAVTVGPGLAPALGVGVNTAKDLAIKYNKRLVAVNHIEGHIMSNWVKNSKGLPERKIELPGLVLTVSGGHTKIILVKNSNPPKSPFDKGDLGTGPVYEVVGETLDDAAGEALDKASKLLGLGYPGGPVIERLALTGDKYFLKLPHSMADKKTLDYSFSGLKTSFYYQIRDWPKNKIGQNLNNLASSFQEAVWEQLLRKYKLAIERYQPKSLLACGGVMANLELRKRLRKLAKEMGLPIYMPTKKWLNTDNAAMIGMAGYFRAMRGEWADPKTLDRDPRARV